VISDFGLERDRLRVARFGFPSVLSSYLLTFPSSHLLIFLPSHLLIFPPSYLLSFPSSYLLFFYSFLNNILAGEHYGDTVKEGHAFAG
jgi:hypothetical protein